MHPEPYHATREAVAAQALHARSLRILYDIAGWTLIEQARLLEQSLRNHQKSGFNPSQPRDDHGRWTDGGGSGSNSGYDLVYEGDPDPPIEPVYPIEEAIGLMVGGGMVRGAVAAARGARAAASIEKLSVNQTRNLTRFKNKLPKNSQSPKITHLSNGKKMFHADVPAKNIPGSYARYEKVVDKAGRTVSYKKITYGPDGRIIHSKVKFP